MSVNGLHHITAISGPAQENLDFYAGILGMRLVKRSVNQDDPGTYHLFYADAEGRPGTDLTFFPWAQMAPPRDGYGRAMEISLEVPAGSLDLLGRSTRRNTARACSLSNRASATGAAVCRSAWAEGGAGRSGQRTRVREFTPWDHSPVPAERQVRGLYGAAALGARRGGNRALSDDGARVRRARHGARVDALRVQRPHRQSSTFETRPTAGAGSGASAACTISPGAWMTKPTSCTCAQAVEEIGGSPTPVIDRFWFKSVYFQEPGGVLFELATDGPGFAVDEDPAHLGETLVLPPFLERHRDQIEKVLPS